MRTLQELWNSAYYHVSRLQWRIFDQSGKKICKDYGKTYSSPLDNMEVIKATIKESKSGQRYVRVTVKQKPQAKAQGKRK